MIHNILKLILFSILFFILFSCGFDANKKKKLEGIWTSYKSIHNNDKNFIIAFQNDKLIWYTEYLYELQRLKYQIKNDTLFMYHFVDGKYEPSIVPSGQILFKNDSIFWLSTTPREVLVFEKSSASINKSSFDKLTKQSIRNLELPTYRKK